MVHELDLNTRIWTKDADESLLHARDAGPDAFDSLAARGNVTATELWEAAVRSVGDDDDPSELVPAPPGTSVRVEHGGGGTVVRYGLSPGFVVAVLLSVASGAVLVVAARALPDALSMPELARPTSWIPTVPLRAGGGDGRADSLRHRRGDHPRWSTHY